MSKIDQGVLIFNEWFESAKGLSGLEFKKLFLAMYDFQINGKEPPSFTAKGDTLARVIFPCLEKRVSGAIYAKLGAQKNDNCSEPGKASGVPAGVKSETPGTKEENNKEKQRNTLVRASREKDEMWDEFFEAAKRRALGEKA